MGCALAEQLSFTESDSSGITCHFYCLSQKGLLEVQCQLRKIFLLRSVTFASILKESHSFWIKPTTGHPVPATPVGELTCWNLLSCNHHHPTFLFSFFMCNVGFWRSADHALKIPPSVVLSHSSTSCLFHCTYFEWGWVRRVESTCATLTTEQCHLLCCASHQHIPPHVSILTGLGTVAYFGRSNQWCSVQC